MPVSGVIAAKIAIDFSFQLWAIHLYRRWTGERGEVTYGHAFIASLIEPFSFQLLRHLGAAWGWVLFLTGRYLKEHGQLTVNGHPPLVVATVMSNLGLERALAGHGIGMLRTPVGDKYVLEEMLRRGAVLGGEQSGHIIFHRYATTGDGMLTALRVFEVMRQTGTGLDELTQEIQVYPQLLVNVRIKERKRLEDLPAVVAEIRAAEDSFGDSGRVLVRFSGTGPLARVMVEGPELDRVEAFANRIAARLGYSGELRAKDRGRVKRKEHTFLIACEIFHK